MTEKHFNAIAAALAGTKPNCGNTAMQDQWLFDVRRALSQTNPRFDSERFAAACGVPVE